MVEMTTKMKTFKQYSKEEDKGYYINKDGVAVILEPIGNHRPRNNKNVSEEFGPEIDGKRHNLLFFHHKYDKHKHDQTADDIHNALKRTSPKLSDKTIKAIKKYSSGSHELNKNLIAKHSNKPLPHPKEDMSVHDEMMKGYQKAGTNFVAYAGVSDRVHKNMKASSDKLHSSPTHVSASVHAEGAKQFAELKQKSDNPHDELHYAAYHINKNDEVCHVHPHSPMYSGGGGDEHEVTIKPHSVWKHVGTTTHLSNTGGWHVVDHFKRHKS